MNTTQSAPQDDWIGSAERVYLDTGVFASKEGLEVIRDQVLPAVKARRGRVSLMVYAATLAHFSQPQAGPSTGDSALQALLLLKDLQAAQGVVTWLPPSDQPGDPSAAASIRQHCLENQHKCVQVLITQDDALASLVEKNSRSTADRDARPVQTFCVEGWQLRGWTERRRGAEKVDIRPEELRDRARGMLIAIDSSSFLFTLVGAQSSPQPPALGLRFIENVMQPFVRANQSSFLIPAAVKRELEKLANLPTDPPKSPGLAGRAQAALQLIDRFSEAGTLTIDGDRVPGQHADPNFVHMALRFGMERDLLMLIQDEDNAQRLLDNMPPPPRRAIVARIDKAGRNLIDWWALRRQEQDRSADGDKPREQPRPKRDSRQPAEANELGAKPPETRRPDPQEAASATLQDEPAPPRAPPPAPPAPPPAPEPTPEPEDTTASPELVSGAHAIPRRGLPRKTIAVLASLAVLGTAFSLWRGQPAAPREPFSAATARQAALRVQLLVDGRPVSTSGEEIFLRNGTRFVVQMQAEAPGQLELQITNASDPSVATTLYRGQNRPRTVAESSALRVTGSPGVDRLRVVHVADPEGSISQWEMSIRHD